MTDNIPHETLLDALKALNDATIGYVSKTWPSVEVTMPKTYGERIKELEWEIQHLKEDRNNLAAELDVRGQRIVDLTSQVDYWHNDAEGLRENNVAAYEALPSYVKRAHVGMSLAELVGKLAEYQKVDQELREAAIAEAAQARADLAEMTESRDIEQEERRDQLRAILIGHGLGIDDDTTDDLLSKLSDGLTELSNLRARVKSQQEQLANRDAQRWSVDNHSRLVTQVRRITGDHAIPMEAPPGALIGALQRTVEPAHYKAVIAERDDTITTLRTHLAAASEANERQRVDLTAARQELTKLRVTHHEWVNGQRQKPPSLNDLQASINEIHRRLFGDKPKDNQ